MDVLIVDVMGLKAVDVSGVFDRSQLLDLAFRLVVAASECYDPDPDFVVPPLPLR